MPLRPFRLPADLPLMEELLPPSFQYPENEAWNFQTDEVESFVDMINSIRRVWPLLRLLQVFAPSLRDVLRGFIWEEDGRAVGLANLIRQGNTDRWLIGNVGVLPAYRRRGIARQLVEACVELARHKGGAAVVLDVVSGNIPACTLYRRLGFEPYNSLADLFFDPATHPLRDAIPLPGGFSVEQHSPLEWRPRYDLARRTTPAEIQRYVPVEEGRYRQPSAMRPLLPLLTALGGTQQRDLTVRCDADGLIVATGYTNARVRTGGVNAIGLMVDPAHAELAPALLRRLLIEVQGRAPGRRVELNLPRWQGAVEQAALDAGFALRLTEDSMGLLLSQPD